MITNYYSIDDIIDTLNGFLIRQTKVIIVRFAQLSKLQGKVREVYSDKVSLLLDNDTFMDCYYRDIAQIKGVDGDDNERTKL